MCCSLKAILCLKTLSRSASTKSITIANWFRYDMSGTSSSLSLELLSLVGLVKPWPAYPEYLSTVRQMRSTNCGIKLFLHLFELIYWQMEFIFFIISTSLKILMVSYSVSVWFSIILTATILPVILHLAFDTNHNYLYR